MNSIMDNPLISIITPSYKRVYTGELDKCIQSVDNQLDTRWRHFIIGDACPELESYKKKLEKSQACKEGRRVIINLEKNSNDLGVSPLNHGISISGEPYYAILADDNVWLPHHLAALLEFMERNKDLYGFAYGNQILKHKHIPEYYRIRIANQPEWNHIDLGDPIYKRELWLKYGPYKYEDRPDIGDIHREGGKYSYDWHFIYDCLKGGEQWVHMNFDPSLIWYLDDKSPIKSSNWGHDLLRIGGLPVGDGGVAWYRMKYPLNLMTEKKLAYSSYIPPSMTEYGTESWLQNQEVLIFQGVGSDKTVHLINRLKAAHKVCVTDVDDYIKEVDYDNTNYHNIGRKNVSFKFNDRDVCLKQLNLWKSIIINQHGLTEPVDAQIKRVTTAGEDIKDFELVIHKHGYGGFDVERNLKALAAADECYRQSDGIQTTTEYFAKKLREFNENVFVFPNCLDFKLWDANLQFVRNDNKIRIVWSGGSCCDEETEILTRNGFRYFRDLLPQDEVATLNKNGYIEYHKPTAIIKQPYSGLMYLCEKEQVNFCVTPNHKLYLAKSGLNSSKQNLKFNLIKAEDQPSHYFIKKNAKWEGKDQKYFILPAISSVHRNGFGGYYPEYPRKDYVDSRDEIAIDMEDWMKFFGFWIAEGWTSKTSWNYKGKKNPTMQVGISQKKDISRLREIEEIMARYGFKGHYTKDKSQYRICDMQLWSYLLPLGDAKTKYIPTDILDLSPRLLKIFLEWYIKGDGHVEKNGRTRAWTASKKLADNLVEIALKIGWAANVSFQPPRKSYIKGREIFGSGCYCIAFLKDNNEINRLHPEVYRKEVKKIDYSGNIYCVDVPNHIFYMRRKGMSGWTGNSHLEDLMLVRDALVEILHRHPECIFICAGFTPEGFARVFDSKQVEIVPWHDFKVHPYLLHRMRPDIGIIPLRNTEFANCKSPIKWTELSALGVPCVVSNSVVYNTDIEDGKTGFLFDTPQQFIEQMEILINNEQKRREIGQSALEYVKENFDIEKWTPKLLRWYEGMWLKKNISIPNQNTLTPILKARWEKELGRPINSMKILDRAVD